MRTCVIAECGSNHNGDLQTALSLIARAADVGCTAAKFQMFTLEDIQPKHLISEENRRYQVSPEWLPYLSDACDTCGIEFMCTPFSLRAVEALEKYVHRWKIASYEAGREDLLKAVEATGKPIIIAAGRSHAHAIQRRLPHASILRCVSQYPAKVDGYLNQFYGRMHDGLSDHTLSLILPALAVARGAKIIEKHFTLSRGQQGPDHGHSVTPTEMLTIIQNIQEAEEAVYGAQPPTPSRPDRLEWVLEDGYAAARRS